MNAAVLDKIESANQYILKSRVHELQPGSFRGYVEIMARSANGFDSRLKYCPLTRHTWDEAISDAERLAERLADSECRGSEVHVFSTRTNSSFDTFMNMLAARPASTV